MASNDTFAWKLKEETHLSHLLEEGIFAAGQNSFDFANLVWRIFMHKTVQPFMKKHDMELKDVMNKSSITSKLFEEVIQGDRKSYDNHFSAFFPV